MVCENGERTKASWMGVQGEKRDDSESTYDECELFLRAGRACHQGHCITSRVNVAHYVVAGLGLALLDAKRGCGVPGRLQHVALGIARLGLCRQREPGSFGCVFEQVLALTRSYPPPVVQQDAYVLRYQCARSDSPHINRACGSGSNYAHAGSESIYHIDVSHQEHCNIHHRSTHVGFNHTSKSHGATALKPSCSYLKSSRWPRTTSKRALLVSPRSCIRL